MVSGTPATRCGKRNEVATVCCIPSVLLVSFFLSLTTHTRTCNDQWLAEKSCRACESLPSLRVPASHCTKPPNNDLHAEPDPCRAITLKSSSDATLPNWNKW
eukprot:Lithocolla_globosa_v1_NODE_5854_length_1175_cov_1.945536.p2 type:complete len:102 gc:universal NODE_5854_length_1175_cov_1.945536:740-435(-)